MTQTRRNRCVLVLLRADRGVPESCAKPKQHTQRSNKQASTTTSQLISVILHGKCDMIVDYSRLLNITLDDPTSSNDMGRKSSYHHPEYHPISSTTLLTYLCIYIYVCVHIYIYMCVCVRVRVYKYIYKYICINI